jgi:outer membrane protein assembly factor BamB
VIYLSTPGMIFAVKASDGTQLWQHLCSCRGASVPVVLNGVVYFASETGEIDALNSSEGTQVWQYKLPPEEIAPGSITGNDPAPLLVNNIVYEIEPLTDNVYALNANDGTLHWHIHLNNEQTGILSASNGVVYVTTEGNSPATSNLYALRANTGEQLWSKQNLSLQLIAADTLYCFGVATDGGFTNDLYALHAFDGTTRWHIHIGSSGISYGPRYVSVLLMTVYVMTDTTLYALHANDGSIAWQSSTSGYMVGS